jgi:sulfoxide reductase catalytic subunit YedY
MQRFSRKPWDLPQRAHTPREVYERFRFGRRDFLASLFAGAACASGIATFSGCQRATDAEIREAGAVDLPSGDAKGIYPAKRNEEFEYGRPETIRRYAAEYTNFFEFTSSKDVWRYVGEFKPTPWTLSVGGLCSNPLKLDLDEIYKRFHFEERAYRHRCVETWAMCVPWTGFPLRDLLKLVEPQPKARYVMFQSFSRPEEAPGIQSGISFPWPYTEGLTLAEATNELALLVTGIYGEPLPKQHGAPIRLVVPWKYGFKSIKSIERITLTDKQPPTFWNTLVPHEYAFEANVEPDVPHPRWSQRREWMLGPARETYDTLIYNGYGEYVAGLYKA